MDYRTRKMIKPGDLNPSGSLYGGQLLYWIDEEAAIYAMCQLDVQYGGDRKVVTKSISEIDFVSPAKVGEIVEIGVEAVHFGTTSLGLHVIVRNKNTGKIILEIERMTFVLVDENNKKIPHGVTSIKE